MDSLFLYCSIINCYGKLWYRPLCGGKWSCISCIMCPKTSYVVYVLHHIFEQEPKEFDILSCTIKNFTTYCNKKGTTYVFWVCSHVLRKRHTIYLIVLFHVLPRSIFCHEFEGLILQRSNNSIIVSQLHKGILLNYSYYITIDRTSFIPTGIYATMTCFELR